MKKKKYEEEIIKHEKKIKRENLQIHPQVWRNVYYGHGLV